MDIPSKQMRSQLLFCKSTRTPAFLTPVPPSLFKNRPLQICNNPFCVRVGVSRPQSSTPCRSTVPLRISLSLSSERVADNLSSVSESVIKAVETLSRQPRQTVEDIAATAGLSIAEATDEAVKLAALTGASIDVTEDGDIAYRFPSNVRGTLRTRSLLASLTMTWQRISPTVFLAGRIAFGVLLILSIVLTFIAIIAISSAGRDDDRRRDRDTIIAPRFFFGPNPFDIMFYRRPYGYTMYDYSRGRGNTNENSRSEMSFLESVYSFVFGDGDPNFDFDERRWKAVAKVIRANRGAVTAEQLAPLLDPPLKQDNSSAIVDESFMLPALTRFQGHPEVTESGDIIYVFPNILKTGARTVGTVEMVGSNSITPALEQEVKLTRASDSQRFLVLALGAVNLFGVSILGGKLLSAVPVTADAAQLISFVRSVYPALLTYATSFFAVPILRWFGIRRQNSNIRKRNEARTESARRLAQFGSNLRKKLKAAEDFIIRGGNVRTEDVVYSSDRDSLDQPKLREDFSDEFDRRLNKGSQ